MSQYVVMESLTVQHTLSLTPDNMCQFFTQLLFVGLVSAVVPLLTGLFIHHLSVSNILSPSFFPLYFYFVLSSFFLFSLARSEMVLANCRLSLSAFPPPPLFI